MGWIGFEPHGLGFTYHMCVREGAAGSIQSGLHLLVKEPGLGVGWDVVLCCRLYWLR